MMDLTKEQNIERILKIEDKMRAESEKAGMGWIVHGIPLENEKGEHINTHYHSHGIKPYNNDYELEIVDPASFQGVNQIINTIGLELKHQTMNIASGDMNNTLFNMPIKFVLMQDVMHENAYVYRVIIPDENGLFPEDVECNPKFKIQLCEKIK